MNIRLTCKYLNYFFPLPTLGSDNVLIPEPSKYPNPDSIVVVPVMYHNGSKATNVGIPNAKLLKLDVNKMNCIAVFNLLNLLGFIEKVAESVVSKNGEPSGLSLLRIINETDIRTKSLPTIIIPNGTGIRFWYINPIVIDPIINLSAIGSKNAPNTVC